MATNIFTFNHLKIQKKYWAVFTLVSAAMLFCTLPANAQFYRGSQLEFGKNRVQYTPFNWTYYQFSKYRVYFHTGGIELANYSAKGIQSAFAEMESRLDYQFEGRANFIVYNKIEEFRQSNIGLNQEDDYNLGGAERFQGDKVFLYFEGNHEDLNYQIKKGVADIVSRKVLYGNDWKEVIKNTAFKLAVDDEPIFTNKSFEDQISKELKGNFDSENKVGFF